ncbi:ClpX C4-type zinc finger protein [Phreatobacter oligotrophus]|uniref:ClpX C4-type zinc finger protein n=1 Tax=Phreatobacter oligotrophus TaxID=1122261 RepID=UPI003CCC070A
MRRKLCCSFCGKSEREVAKLAAGPGGVHICDACVQAGRLFMSGTAALPRDFDPATWPTDRFVAALGPLHATAEAHREHLAKIVDTLRHREVSSAKIAEPPRRVLPNCVGTVRRAIVGLGRFREGRRSRLRAVLARISRPPSAFG